MALLVGFERTFYKDTGERQTALKKIFYLTLLPSDSYVNSGLLDIKGIEIINSDESIDNRGKGPDKIFYSLLFCAL